MAAGRAERPRERLSAGQIARRSLVITCTKWLLPALALALLTALAMWPQLNRAAEQGRIAFRRLAGEVDGARLTEARYRGVDERNRPYTLTATTAVQATPDRVNLEFPKGDVTLEDGKWLMVSANDGVFMQHANQLDLSHDVVLYRDDGTTMHTETATVDLKNGAAVSDAPVSAEGPFGTLDGAHGFTLTDKGEVIQFPGPARLVMNGAGR